MGRTPIDGRGHCACWRCTFAHRKLVFARTQRLEVTQSALLPRVPNSSASLHPWTGRGTGERSARNARRLAPNYF